jgi:hypothetical protein
MEILSFTLGMLAIVAIALVITIVVGIVKVFKIIVRKKFNKR